ETNGIVQYHLSGTSDDAMTIAPMKLLFDEVRHWARQRDCRVIHMGGGTPQRMDDPLLHFKLGFSRRTHDFSIWRWVVFPDMYERFSTEKARWNAGNARQA